MNQSTNVFTQRIGCILQRLSHSRMVAPGVEHANGLRALAGKYERKRIHVSIFIEFLNGIRQ
ncbi:hypothetical protein D3C72_2480150 [compost metagenome]